MPYEVPVEQLYRPCDLREAGFETTAELEPTHEIIGQARGTQALEFGLSVDSPGYNIYLLGEAGTGRTTAVQRYLADRARNAPTPSDWVYVFNFERPECPRAIELPAGQGRALRDALEGLLSNLRTALQSAFAGPEFREAADRIRQQATEFRRQAFAALQAQANALQAAILATEEGLQIVPLEAGQVVPPEAFAAWPPERQQTWREQVQPLEAALEQTVQQVRQAEAEAERAFQDLVQRTAALPIDTALQPLFEQFTAPEELVQHLRSLRQDLLAHLDLFTAGEQEAPAEPDPLRRYRVNLLVDHSHTQGAPVLVEYQPTPERLLGRVEYETRPGGGLHTDFTLIRPGVLHRANGGFLVLRARDLFTEEGGWEALERALLGGQVAPHDPASSGPVVRSIDPEPIPLRLKVILIGPPYLYFRVLEDDEDFQSLFKVMADFATTMERSPENERRYAAFIATLCREEGLPPFDRAAVERVVEYGSRLAETQRRLSTRFGLIADLVREASLWAVRREHPRVQRDDVEQAIAAQEQRHNRPAERDLRHILDGYRLINTDGARVGEINGLYVVSVGDFQYGMPDRITVRAFAGRWGVVQVDREVNLTGPIHNKGVLTIMGYLGGQYGRKRPLDFSAQINFEQNYSGMEGDSASAAQLFALLSAIGEVPIRQSIAVTGSINQFGEIQAIGGVNEKIEGWYRVCRARGLTGDQGVLIPHSNLPDLMLHAEVRQAVAEGRFHIWAMKTVDEGLEVLTGKPAQEVHQAVREGLHRLSGGRPRRPSWRERLRQRLARLNPFRRPRKEPQDGNSAANSPDTGEGGQQLPADRDGRPDAD
ncbi:MAG: ATP-binding protein [Anaerolineae bacterium]|nr:MAG: ATP-binding protein [Anaerolineae bacterium]